MPKLKKYQLSSFNRISFLIAAAFLLSFIIFIKLAYLQIYKHEQYFNIAQKEHLGYTELPARRGEILTQDYHSGETFKLATNITLDLLYADPTLIRNKQLAAETLAPLIFDIEEEKAIDEQRVKEEWAKAENEQERNNIKFLNEEELLEHYKKRLEQELSQETRETILLGTNFTEEEVELIRSRNLQGITVINNNIYAAPKEITDREKTAAALSEIVDINESDLEKILIGKNRYIILRKKISPEISKTIKEIIKNDQDENFIGLGLKENYYRFYPEKTFLSQTLGFVDHQNLGRYGIEETFNAKLKGKTGIFSSQRDANGKQITVGENIIKPAVDGDNIFLSIDRSIQTEVESKLKRAVEKYRADSGQVIIMEPTTGRLITMAQYPSFDPNEYGNVFDKEEISLSEDEINRLTPLEKTENPKHFMLTIDKDRQMKLEIFKKEDENGNIKYLKYKNKVGPQVYRNSMIADIYEPGSVFKVITMTAAINDHDVTPKTTTYVGGPLPVDCKPNGECDYEIKNALHKYLGNMTMTQVLEQSDNVGISFVANKLGRTLFYNYMQNFGFMERTDIELDNEHPGQIEYFTDWSESELLTHGFGQGIATTPIQMATAFCAIINGGLLMQPYIVDRIEHESGKITQTDSHIVRRVISKETSDTMISMMVSAVENGVANKAQIKDHYIGGKTGTSQTYKNGEALVGAGTTIGSFVGFGPIDNPKFVVLIKFDRARSSEWGSGTAAPLFAEIGEYLFNYYNIPPDK